MTTHELSAIVRGLMPTLVEIINRRIDTRLQALGPGPRRTEGDISVPSVGAHLATPDTAGKPTIVHRGMWDPDRVYSDGDGILHKGLGYRAVSASVRCEPGSDPNAWERL